MTEFSPDRREFTLQAALLLLSGVAITVSGCGGGGSSPSSPNPPAAGDVSGTISSNHGRTSALAAAVAAMG